MKVVQHFSWSPFLASGLAFAVGDDEAEIAKQVNQGIAQAYSFDDARAFCVLRMDSSEFVVVCFEGEGLVDYCHLLIESARAARAKTIRFHTKNKAVGRMVREFGVEEKETVFSMSL